MTAIIRDYELNYVVNGAAGVSMLRSIKTELALVDADTRKAEASVRALNATLGQTAAQTASLGTHMGSLGGSIRGVGDQAQGLIPAWKAFEIGVSLAQTFGDYINRARENLQRLGEQAAETRDKMRELANLKGETGPNDAVVAETIMLGMSAGLKPDEARQFMEQFEGSIPAGRQKGNIAPELERPLAAEVMRFGNRVKLNPGTAGDLAGVLSQYGRIGSVEEGAGQVGAIAHGLNEGRGNLEPLMRSLIKTAGAVVEENGGAVADLPQLAAFLGVSSTNNNPDRAGTMLRNAVKGLRHFKDDDQGRALKDLGITPRMKFGEALERIAPALLKADEEGDGADVWMTRHGFDNHDEITGVVQQARNLKVVRERVAAARDTGQGKKVMQADEVFLDREKTGVHKMNEAETEAQKFIIGQREEMRVEARVAGANKLGNDGWRGGKGNEWRHWLLDGLGQLPKVGFKPNEKSEAETEFMGMLFDEGKKVGVDVFDEFLRTKGDYAGSVKMHARSTDAEKREILTRPTLNNFDAQGGRFVPRMIEKVMERGGNPFAGSKAATAEKLKGLIDHERAQQRDQVVGKVVEGGARVGLDVMGLARKALPGREVGPGEVAGLAGGAFLRAAAEGVQARGGDPFGGSAVVKGLFEKMIREQEKTNALLGGPGRDRTPPGAGPVVPGRK